MLGVPWFSDNKINAHALQKMWNRTVQRGQWTRPARRSGRQCLPGIAAFNCGARPCRHVFTWSVSTFSLLNVSSKYKRRQEEDNEPQAQLQGRPTPEHPTLLGTEAAFLPARRPSGHTSPAIFMCVGCSSSPVLRSYSNNFAWD